MKKLLITASCLLFVLPAAANLTHEVQCREIGFSKSAEERNMAAFRSFIDADARFVSNSTLRGVEAIAEAWSVFFTDDGPRIKWRPRIIEVLDDGELALSRGPYRVISTDAEGNTVESWGTFNSVWRLHDDGQWRVVFDAGSPAAEEPDAETRAVLDDNANCG